jgi:hypothetical protein
MWRCPYFSALLHICECGDGEEVRHSFCLLAALQQFQITSAGTKQLNKSSLKLSHQTYNMVKLTLSPLLSSRLKRVKFEPRFRVRV